MGYMLGLVLLTFLWQPLLEKPPLVPNTWYIVANGYSGRLTLERVQNGVMEGTLLGDEVRGTYNEKTHCLTLQRMRYGKTFQTYTGYLFQHPQNNGDTRTFAGTFTDVDLRRDPNRPVFGWYAV